MIGVIDYRAGNLRSVETALAHLGVDYKVLDKPEGVAGVDRLIFPGVGHAGHAMIVLKETGLDRAIADFFKTGKPVLGICVGSQVVLDKSDESDIPCLGLLRGTVHHFKTLLEPISDKSENNDGLAHDLGGFRVGGERLKVPHMGWNTVRFDESEPMARDLFRGIPQDRSFYFVHSYYTQPEGTTRSLCAVEYGASFCAGVGRDNLAAFQFHPEKSGRWGLKLLENFTKVA